MSAEEKVKMTVEIFGTSYKLLSGSSVDYTKMVADHVDDEMKRIAKGYPRLDAQRIAVLAAVNMADEYYRMKTQLDELKQYSIKVQSLEQAYDQLDSKYGKLQEDYQQAIPYMKELEEQIAKLQQSHELAINQLQADNKELSKELEDNRAKMQNEGGIYEEYRKLQEDHEKLKKEYNEWIQILDSN